MLVFYLSIYLSVECSYTHFSIQYVESYQILSSRFRKIMFLSCLVSGVHIGDLRESINELRVGYIAFYEIS
jgi:hypothetical protein